MIDSEEFGNMPVGLLNLREIDCEWCFGPFFERNRKPGIIYHPQRWSVSTVSPARPDNNIAIGRILRRAVGLPDEEDPFIKRWDEPHLPNLELVASSIIIASYGKAPIVKTPKAVSNNLREIRAKLRHLRAQIAAIDGETESTINRSGSSLHQALKATEDPDEIVALHRAISKTPREEWTLPAALTAMERLEDALVSVIELATKNSKSELITIPATGRPPNMAKLEVALIVGEFLKEATGEVPMLWPDDAPAEPWKRGESSEPFAVALREIFQILGFKPGINRAGDFATSKL